MSESAQKINPWSPWHERLHKKLQKDPNLLPQNETILLAISGGQDSMALLKLILDLKRIYKWKIYIWHGNHGWHSKSSKIAEELKFWSIKQNIDFICTQGSKQQTYNEKAARDWRYKNLIKEAEKLSLIETNKPCKRVVTGHTATDRAETLIMNLARGTNLAGLSTLRHKRKLSVNIKLIRPLLIFSRNETAQICKEMKLPIWLDPSNTNLTLTRNKIRQKILPVLEEMHKGSDLRIAALAERLTKYNDDQRDLAEALLKTFQDKNDQSLCRRALITLPSSARTTIISTWLMQSGVPMANSLQLEELSHKLGKGMPPGNVDLPKGSKITWNKEKIELSFKEKE